MDYEFLRTVSLRAKVPWYDAIPQIGAVLFLAGWWAATRGESTRRNPAGWRSLTRAGTLGLFVLVVLLIVLNRPRVDAAVRNSVPALVPWERQSKLFALDRQQTLRANVLLLSRAESQRKYLMRLDLCEDAARRLGLSRESIRAVLGHPWIPASTHVVRDSLYELYDAVAVLNLPERGGRPVDPATIRSALAEYLAEDPEPRPFWIADPKVTWPPAYKPPGAE
jgi:hypothetical protein